jgi:diamine N-acetyltransferase
VISLREVTRDNVRAICELKLRPGQERYSAPAAYTVAEAAYEPDGWLRAIYLDERPIGVTGVLPEETPPYLVRLMIDCDHQRRGYGRQAHELIAAEMRSRGATELSTSYRPGPGEPRGFYLGLGYEETGEPSDGERGLLLDLTRPRSPAAPPRTARA